MIKNSQKILVIAILLIIGVAFIYFSNTGNENGYAENNSGDVPENKTETETIVLPIVDGLVEEEEYSNLVYDAATGISVGWTNNDVLCCIILLPSPSIPFSTSLMFSSTAFHPSHRTLLSSYRTGTSS